MKGLRVTAPAKINLFLRVLGRRPDGYHNIETIFQAIDLYDELIIRECSGPSSLEVPGAPELENYDNLVMRAVRWLEKAVQRPISVRILLSKKIPVAAGLGGGSSDAAGALTGIRSLFDLPVSDEDLNRGALSLGADVPFFLIGGTAIGEGVGERVTPVDLPVSYGILLVNPGFPVSTARVFREFSNALTGKARQGTLWQLLREAGEVERLLHNDLQPVSEKLYPEISEIRHTLEKQGAQRVLMSGSGPTVFAIGNSQEIERVRQSLPQRWQTSVARPIPAGTMID